MHKQSEDDAKYHSVLFTSEKENPSQIEHRLSNGSSIFFWNLSALITFIQDKIISRENNVLELHQTL